ncbi:MAG: hypothetical protein R3D02_11595 [Hyphomicrobiales bacterium]
MSAMTSTKLYMQVAVLRRKVLLRQAVRKAVAGALAVAAIIVAAGFATAALFLVIREPLGDLGAVLALAGLYLAVAVVLLAYTLHEPQSAELDTLSEMEAAALDAAMADNSDIINAFGSTGQRLHDIGSTVSVGIGVLSALRRMVKGRKTA